MKHHNMNINLTIFQKYRKSNQSSNTSSSLRTASSFASSSDHQREGDLESPMKTQIFDFYESSATNCHPPQASSVPYNLSNSNKSKQSGSLGTASNISSGCRTMCLESSKESEISYYNKVCLWLII